MDLLEALVKVSETCGNALEQLRDIAVDMPAIAGAVERMAAARSAIDALDPTVMLVGRNENFRVPGMPASESIARAVPPARPSPARMHSWPCRG